MIIQPSYFFPTKTIGDTISLVRILHKSIQWLVRAIFLLGGWILEIFQRIEDKFIYLLKKPEYVRKGACQQSGTCCQNIGIVIPESWLRRPWLARAFVRWHRYRYNFIYLGKTDNMLIYECRYLSKDHRCSIYRFRPRLCREFPKEILWGYPKLHRGCGFYFVKRGGSEFRTVLEKEKKKL